MINRNKKIATAISGGIDSLVAAFILKKKKFDVTGLHFFTGYETRKRSDIEKDLLKMCDFLEIPIVFLDIKERFNKDIVSYFKDSYKKGLTPNPCLVCNPLIKFSLLIDEAEKLGINKIATGHYVNTKMEENGSVSVLKGKDPLKDQSYFLSMVNPENLKKVVFPLGNLKKTRVKKIAERYGLIPVEKNESQDICFIQNKKYGDFLEKDKSFTFKPGKIVDRNGKVIGSHKGLHNFTIGQRKGLNCPGPHPYYVLDLQPQKNRLIIGTKQELLSNSCFVKDINWFEKPDQFPFEADVKIRYSHSPAKALIHEAGDNRLKIEFKEPVSSITPGQGAVFYNDDKVTGAGFIIK